jgi:hypothetical protein
MPKPTLTEDEIAAHARNPLREKWLAARRKLRIFARLTAGDSYLAIVRVTGGYGDVIHNPLSAYLISAPCIQLCRSFIGADDAKIMQCASGPLTRP